MEYENNEIEISHEKDKCNKLLKTQKNNITVSNTNIIPDENSNDDSKEDKNIKKRKTNIFRQFLIRKVNWIALVVYSIVSIVLPFIEIRYEYVDLIKLNDKIIRKRIGIEISNGHPRKANRKKIYTDALIPMIYFCFIGPFVEEFLYRYLIFGLINRYGQRVKNSNKLCSILIVAFAFIFSSVLFSYGHFYMSGDEALIDIIYYRKYFDKKYFVKGLIFAWFYYQYDFISINILAQMINNIVEIAHIFFMFTRDCYDACGIYEVLFKFPIYGFNILILIKTLNMYIFGILETIYEKCKAINEKYEINKKKE